MAQMVKNLPAMQETRVRFLGWEDPLEKKWLPTPVFLPENSIDRGAWRATVHGVARVGHYQSTNTFTFHSIQAELKSSLSLNFKS